MSLTRSLEDRASEEEAEEKKGLVERIRRSIDIDYGFASMMAVLAVASGQATILGYQNQRMISRYHQIYGAGLYPDNPPVMALAFAAILTLVSIAYVSYKAGVIAGKYGQIASIKEEIEKIEKNPAYKKLA